MFLKEPTMEEYFLITWCVVIPLLGLALGLLITWAFEKDNNQEENEDGEI